MIIVVMSFLVFIPLLRYWHDYPDMFSFRAFSRVTAVEAPLPGPAGEIFFSNLWRAMTMFAWDDGEIWVISIPHRPALDVVSAALFYLGMGILLIRWIRRRHWADLFLILAVPLMMMPSILSLAFPNENPAVNRASAVLIPVFLIVAIALDAILRTIRARLGAPWGRRIAWGLGLILLLFAVNQNYDLVFNQYRHSFDQGAWNTAEMGSAVRAFGELTGTTETAWVLAFPYWVDGRLVGINGGDPRDLSIWPEQLNTTLMDPRAKLFVVNKDDQNGLNALQSAYPQGSLQIYELKIDESKNFYLFFVPPSRSLVP